MGENVLTTQTSYLSDFESFAEARQETTPSWLSAIRRQAFSRFRDLGLPTIRDEEWKYTNVTPITQAGFGLVPESAPRALAAREIEPFSFGQPGWSRLVFVDGLYSRELSSLSRLPRGVVVESLAEALCRHSDLVEPHLCRHAGYEDNAFVALNTAFLRDGAFVYLPAGREVEQPIHLLFLSTSREGAASYPRVLVVAGRGSRAAVVESYAAWGADSYWNNGVTEIVAGEGALLEHYKVQRESVRAFHVASTRVILHRDSSFSSFSFSLGAKLSRNDLNVLLDAEGIRCGLDGLYLASGRQHVDNHTAVDHARPNCSSREFYKGVLQGRARAVFNGKILVRPDAQHTDARQTNKNLLLSEGAEVDTKPQLEIFADDVKCTHGATVGQLDEEAVFYLKSRGLGAETARRVLTYGFAAEVIGRIRLEPVRAELDRLLLGRLETLETQGEAP